VSVAVPGTDADDRHIGPGCDEESVVARRPAVVRHLEVARLQQFGCAQQIGLRLALDVAGEQGATRAVRDPHHDRGLVLLGVGTAVGPARGRREHLDTQRTQASARARHGRAHRDRAFGRELAHPDRGRQVGGQRGRPDRSDGALLHDRRQAVDVVRVGVARDHEVEVATPVGAEPARGAAVASPVDQHPHAGGLDEHRVALADVDDRDHELPYGPRDHWWPEHGDGSRHGRDARRAGPRACEQPHRHRSEGEDAHGLGEAQDAAARAEQVRRTEDDRQGRTREREHRRCEWREQRSDARGDQAHR